MQIYARFRLHFLIFFLFPFFISCGPSKRTLAYEAQLDSVIKSSRSFLGTPYRYGGTSRKGIDCSGLTCNSYSAVEVKLPRTSKDQSKVGKKVKVKKLKKGDLVFFAMTKKKRKITHVGMVTEVSGDKIMFIHASSSKGVVERDLLQEYYLKRLRKSRRVIRKKDI